jgi:hypothetical protein
MTLAKAKDRANKTIKAQSSLMIETYDRLNIFIVQTTGEKPLQAKLRTD